MATSDRFNILVIDPDGDSRNKLKQIALALTTFNKFHNSPSLTEALSKTDGGDKIDIVVISYRFSPAETAEFISAAKKTKSGKEWAYIAVSKSNAGKENIADSVISGFDGFLFEPYSADNLREMAEITSRVKHQSEIARQKTALLMILSDISEHIDAVAFYMSQQKDRGVALKKLRAAAVRLEKFSTPELKALYYEAAMNFFEKVPPPPSAAYTGVSQRVKARMQAKMAKKLEGKYSE